MDELVAQFIGITDSTESKARQYLQITDNNLEQAIELFFTAGGTDLFDAADAAPSRTNPTSTAAGQPDVIELDSDDDEDDLDGAAPRAKTSRPAAASSLESDEEMARRLQEEMYGGGGGHTGAGTDAEGYRAPIARTRETLLGPDSYDLDDPAEMQAAMREQMMAQQRARREQTRRIGTVFNQHEGMWNDEGLSISHPGISTRTPETLSQDQNRSNRLAQMYRPPFDLISPLAWEDARSEGKEESKWLLVNIQDHSVFDCQVLNRDLWKHEGIRETIKENFIFIQCYKEDPRAAQYVQYYFADHENSEAYPYIAIVDPRTGEQVKTWSGPPVPKASDFLMQLHEFLDRYSLDVSAKNPIAKRKPEKRKGVDTMSEEEQLEMAMQASLANQIGSPGHNNTGGLNLSSTTDDPDALTRSIGDLQDLKSPQQQSYESNGAASSTTNPSSITQQPNPDTSTPPSLFTGISSTHPHSEPATTDPGVTRIQFRHPTGRIVRRFALTDDVRRLYEWLKADALEGKTGVPFELVAMGKNLIDSLDQTIEQAGLRNGTVMIEFVGEGDD